MAAAATVRGPRDCNFGPPPTPTHPASDYLSGNAWLFSICYEFDQNLVKLYQNFKKKIRAKSVGKSQNFRNFGRTEMSKISHQI